VEIASWYLAVTLEPPAAEAVASYEELSYVGEESHDGQSHTPGNSTARGLLRRWSEVQKWLRRIPTPRVRAADEDALKTIRKQHANITD